MLDMLTTPFGHAAVNPIDRGIRRVRALGCPPRDRGVRPVIEATPDLTTDPVPATPDGDATIETRVDLPEPCIAPIVFVTSPTGAWFAATGR